jgi:Dam-replacing HTH domain
MGRMESAAMKGDLWLDDVRLVVWEINKYKFTLKDVLEYEDQLQRMHPYNNTVRSQIRHNMQRLRDEGMIFFVDNKGTYLNLELESPEDASIRKSAVPRVHNLRDRAGDAPRVDG